MYITHISYVYVKMLHMYVFMKVVIDAEDSYIFFICKVCILSMEMDCVKFKYIA